MRVVRRAELYGSIATFLFVALLVLFVRHYIAQRAREEWLPSSFCVSETWCVTISYVSPLPRVLRRVLDGGVRESTRSSCFASCFPSLFSFLCLPTFAFLGSFYHFLVYPKHEEKNRFASTRVSSIALKWGAGEAGRGDGRVLPPRDYILSGRDFAIRNERSSAPPESRHHTSVLRDFSTFFFFH